MYKESCLKSELAPRSNSKKMFVETLDVVTSYKDNQQHLKLAVSVTDLAGYPVFETGVELVIGPPDGTKFSLKGETDPYGIAYFELKNIRRGRWEVAVLNVDHPDYKCATGESCKSSSVKHV
ncbi:MAG: hypothetical protein E4H14_19520 [Candidatus Thorarchaeota archaeon]|nr:MAG: hypothetical protein E4H14_19520 [Candidatus Thorarchaeota archaeon]